MKTEYERWNSKHKLNPTTGCWEWFGSNYRGRYGHFRRYIENKWVMAKAHRYAFEYYYKIPREDKKGLLVCHKCDNPSCVNPEHLFLGTHIDNMRDQSIKGRHSFGNNKNHYLLSYAIANEIRVCKINNPNLTYRQIGKIFNTSAPQVYRIIKNLIWKIKEN